MASPDSLAPEDVCSTCSAPGAWVAEGCPPESGAFALALATRLDPTRWRSQFKHAVKFNFLMNLPTQAIKQDHILRGVISETELAVFWVGADGASMLDRESSCSTEGGEGSIPDTEGTWKRLRSMVDPCRMGRPP